MRKSLIALAALLAAGFLSSGALLQAAWPTGLDLTLESGPIAADEPAPAPATPDETKPAAPAAPPAAIAEKPAAPDKITAEMVDRAIENGVKHLLTTQNAEGGWGGYPPGPPPAAGDNREYFKHGYDVCGLMGLAYGELDVNDEQLQKALKLVLAAELDRNYVYAVRVVALSKLYPRLKREQQELVKARLMKDVEWLFKAQSAEGDYNYPGTGLGELSNTQMALMAISEASNIFKELPVTVWQKALARYLETQRADGGWNYGHRSSIHANRESYGSMTAAAVATLNIIRDRLYGGQGCPCKDGRSPRKGLEIDQAIERGIEWLKTNFEVEKNPGGAGWAEFWRFSCERVGLATGMKYFGDHNWYTELGYNILSSQSPDGGWGHTSTTALYIAFLAKGRAPILMNKMQFKGPWNQHPRDLANLAKYLGRMKEQMINWQVINFDVPVGEWHDAPIIYISAEAAVPLTDDQKKKLRQFTDTGGTILYEASCANREAIVWWEKTCKEIWPEWELKVVDKEHPLWLADVPIKSKVPQLMGMSDGLRTFIFYSRVDLSCPWNTEGVAQNKLLFDLGGNLYMYATDRGKLRSRLAGRTVSTESKFAGQAPAKGPKATVTVARVQHGGDWYVGRNYGAWSILGADLKARLELEIKELEPVKVGADVPAEVDLLYVAGRANCDLDATWLKAQLAAGKFLFAEAVMGDPRFDAPLRATLQTAGLKMKELAADSAVLSGGYGGATGYNIQRVACSLALQPERIGKPLPQLFGLYDGEKLVGLYSPFDIMYSQTGFKAYGTRGYVAEDARALATNLALLLSAR